MPPIRFDQIAAPNLNAVSQILARATGNIGGALSKTSDTIGQLAERKKERDSLPALLELAKVQNLDQFRQVADNVNVVNPSDTLIASILGGGERASNLENADAVRNYNNSAADRNRALAAKEAGDTARADLYGRLTSEAAGRLHAGETDEAAILKSFTNQAEQGIVKYQDIEGLVAAAVGRAGSRTNTVDQSVGGGALDESTITAPDLLSLGYLTNPDALRQNVLNDGGTQQAAEIAVNELVNSPAYKEAQALPDDNLAVEERAQSSAKLNQAESQLNTDNPDYFIASEVSQRSKVYEGEGDVSEEEFLNNTLNNVYPNGFNDRQKRRARTAFKLLQTEARAAGANKAQIYALAETILTGDTNALKGVVSTVYKRALEGAVIGGGTGAIAAGPPGVAAGVFTGAIVGSGVGTLEYILSGDNIDLNRDDKLLIRSLAANVSGQNPDYHLIEGERTKIKKAFDNEQNQITERKLIRTYGNPLDGAGNQGAANADGPATPANTAAPTVQQIVSSAAQGTTGGPFATNSGTTSNTGNSLPVTAFDNLANTVGQFNIVSPAYTDALESSIKSVAEKVLKEEGATSSGSVSNDVVSRIISEAVGATQSGRTTLSAAQEQSIIQQIENIIRNGQGN